MNDAATGMNTGESVTDSVPNSANDGFEAGATAQVV